jgi:hypothetical protein
MPWSRTSTTDRLDRLLCRLRLLLAVDHRHVGNVNLQEIVLARTPPQMRHSLDKGHALDVADGTTKLDYTHIRLLIRIVDGYLGNLDDPVLNRIGDVRHNLNRLPQVIALAFTLYDMLVNLARSNVVLARQGNVEVALVVAEIEVDFTAVGKDKNLTVPACCSILGVS